MSRPVLHVAIAIVRRNARYLVARRHDDAHLGGLWEFPGGKIDRDESPEAAAIRELHEECAVEATPIARLDAIQFEYPDRIVVLTPVCCEWQSGEPRPLASQECAWLSPEELAALDMPVANGAILDELREWDRR